MLCCQLVLEASPLALHLSTNLPQAAAATAALGKVLKCMSD
jgi:hypothetical protein